VLLFDRSLLFLHVSYICVAGHGESAVAIPSLGLDGSEASDSSRLPAGTGVDTASSAATMSRTGKARAVAAALARASVLCENVTCLGAAAVAVVGSGAGA
jgi:hypothetical protein